LFGLYNFSSSNYYLKEGKRVIGGEFWSLEENEIPEMNDSTAPILEFPEVLVRTMKDYQPISNKDLMAKIQNIENEMNQLNKKIK
ncbi:MAG: hypothetical protein HQ522_16685, partial [Bacteroidetes bacterium]|nr:hypothetical protein [Bacteroidota bacterium]